MIDYLFIGGAPKCGTSSLFNQLASWPGMNPSQPKETFYFIDRENPLLNSRYNIHHSNVMGFRHFFPDEPGIKLEGTTHLLYQSNQNTNIQELGRVKIIFILRDPVQRLRSSFEYTENNLSRFKRKISFSDFAELLLDDRREEVKSLILGESSKYVLSRDLKYGCYHLFLKNWINLLGQDNVNIIFFEDLLDNPEEELKKIAKWIGVNIESAQAQSFQNRNKTTAIKNKKLHRVARSLSKNIPKGKSKEVLKSIYSRLQGKNKEVSSNIEPTILDKLTRWYEPHNRALQELLPDENIPWRIA